MVFFLDQSMLMLRSWNEMFVVMDRNSLHWDVDMLRLDGHWLIVNVSFCALDWLIIDKCLGVLDWLVDSLLSVVLVLWLRFIVTRRLSAVFFDNLMT